MGLAVLAFWASGHRADPYVDALRPLVDAVGARFLEARLTGGYPSGRRVEPMRGDGVAEADRWVLLAAAARVRSRAEADRSLPNRAALASAHLLVGDAGAAVDILERLTRGAPGDGRLWSDLAAAYLTRAARDDRAEDGVRGLEAAAAAVAWGPAHPEALFNRALALEAVGLRARAWEAWREYLQVETDPGWARVARRRVDALPGPPPLEREDAEASRAAAEVGAEALRGGRIQPGAVRDHVEKALLRRAVRDPAAATEVRRLSRVFADVTRDQSLVDMARELCPGRAGRTCRDQPTLAFVEARTLYDGDRWEESEPLFQAAARGAVSQGAVALWCQVHLAILEYQHGQVEAARARLEAVVTASAGRFPILEGRALRVLALADVARKDFESCERANRTAREAFRRAGDLENAALMSSQMGEMWDRLGDPRQAWANRRLAFEGLPLVRSLGQAVTVHLLGATGALQAGLPRAAREILLNAGLLLAPKRSRLPADAASLEMALARVEEGLGAGRGRPHLARAERAVGGVPDPLFRERLEGELLRTRAEVLSRHGGAEESGPALDEAIAWLAPRSPTRVPPLLLARARQRALQDDGARARADLDEGIDIVERSMVPGQGARLSYFDRTWELYSERLGLEVGGQAPPYLRAFDVASRAWSAATTTRSGAGEPAPALATLRGRLAPGEGVLAYYQTPDATLGWLVTAEGALAAELPVGEGALAAMVEELETLVGEGGGLDAVRDRSGRLYRALVRPFEERLLGLRTVVVVPHRIVFRVPFAALWRADAGRYLWEDLDLALAPSAAFALRRTARRSASLAVCVGAGASGPEATLPSADAEAAAVCGLYAGSRRILSADASVQRLRREIAGASVFHFAGHAVVNDAFPDLSRLLLPGTDAATGAVLAQMSEAGTGEMDLVVLAACRSARPAGGLGAGTFNLLQPFLSNGARQGVGALWDIEDAASTRLLYPVHEAHARGRGVASGLREARTLGRRDEEDGRMAHRDWAGLVLYSTIDAMRSEEHVETGR